MIRDLKLYVMLAIFLAMCVAGIVALRTAEVTPAEPERWPLPDALREASGLAITSSSTVILHNDEEGIIYEFDFEAGRLRKVLTVGDPVVKDDFEGIEVVGGDIYMVNSKGLLYKLPNAMSADGPTVAFETFDTNLQDICEIEGLVFDDGALLLPCKEVYVDEYRDNLTVFAFSPDSQELSVRLSVPFESLEDNNRVHPSAIEADRGHYFIVAAKEYRLIVVARHTRVADSIALSDERHPQAEGISIFENGSVVLADEGEPGVLTRYRTIDDVRAANRSGDKD